MLGPLVAAQTIVSASSVSSSLGTSQYPTGME